MHCLPKIVWARWQWLTHSPKLGLRALPMWPKFARSLAFRSVRLTEPLPQPRGAYKQVVSIQNDSLSDPPWVVANDLMLTQRTVTYRSFEHLCCKLCTRSRKPNLFYELRSID